MPHFFSNATMTNISLRNFIVCFCSLYHKKVLSRYNTWTLVTQVCIQCMYYPQFRRNNAFYFKDRQVLLWTRTVFRPHNYVWSIRKLSLPLHTGYQCSKSTWACSQSISQDYNTKPVKKACSNCIPKPKTKHWKSFELIEIVKKKHI